jgi:hypothetical protein
LWRRPRPKLGCGTKERKEFGKGSYTIIMIIVIIIARIKVIYVLQHMKMKAYSSRGGEPSRIMFLSTRYYHS